MTTNARKWQGKFNELQRIVEEEACGRESMQSKLYMAEKRVSYLCILGSYKSEMSIQAMQILNEKEDLKKNLEESERKKSAKDDEISELSDLIDDIRRSNDSLSSLKMKLQTDLDLLQVRYWQKNNNN